MSQPSLLDLDNQAGGLVDRRTGCLRATMRLADLAHEMGPGAVRQIAATMKCSAHYLNVLARAYREIGPEAIDHEVPISILSAVMESAEAMNRNATEVLEDAIARELSARQIRDEADIAKGRHTASTPWATGNADVIDVDGAQITLALDHEPSGEIPTRAVVTIRPILPSRSA